MHRFKPKRLASSGRVMAGYWRIVANSFETIAHTGKTTDTRLLAAEKPLKIQRYLTLAMVALRPFRRAESRRNRRARRAFWHAVPPALRFAGRRTPRSARRSTKDGVKMPPSSEDAVSQLKNAAGDPMLLACIINLFSVLRRRLYFLQRR